MPRRRSGYMTVDVDLDEALEHIDDASLLAEVADRKLSLGYRDFDPVEDLHDVRNEILRGRPAEALAILDRLILPKWQSLAACELDLKRASTLTIG